MLRLLRRGQLRINGRSRQVKIAPREVENTDTSIVLRPIEENKEFTFWIAANEFAGSGIRLLWMEPDPYLLAAFTMATEHMLFGMPRGRRIGELYRRSRVNNGVSPMPPRRIMQSDCVMPVSCRIVRHR